MNQIYKLEFAIKSFAYSLKRARAERDALKSMVQNIAFWARGSAELTEEADTVVYPLRVEIERLRAELLQLKVSNAIGRIKTEAE